MSRYSDDSSSYSYRDRVRVRSYGPPPPVVVANARSRDRAYYDSSDSSSGATPRFRPHGVGLPAYTVD